ncbi:hypothetical protein BC829DRAFT_471620 [Chytridium lagenaria]|nr:hypothetical protein BC829DRAFT_471620 [Chytridium lagenaria]
MLEENLGMGELPRKNMHNTKTIKVSRKNKNIHSQSRMMNLLRYISLPFDRHDWTVDRCGASVRYVIDF